MCVWGGERLAREKQWMSGGGYAEVRFLGRMNSAKAANLISRPALEEELDIKFSDGYMLFPAECNSQMFYGKDKLYTGWPSTAGQPPLVPIHLVMTPAWPRVGREGGVTHAAGKQFVREMTLERQLSYKL